VPGAAGAFLGVVFFFALAFFALAACVALFRLAAGFFALAARAGVRVRVLPGRAELAVFFRAVLVRAVLRLLAAALRVPTAAALRRAGRLAAALRARVPARRVDVLRGRGEAFLLFLAMTVVVAPLPPTPGATRRGPWLTYCL
jgi:hypothetical protein